METFLSPIRLVLCEDFSLRMISDNPSVDEAAYIQALRSEL